MTLTKDTTKARTFALPSVAALHALRLSTVNVHLEAVALGDRFAVRCKAPYSSHYVMRA